jgi:hypothetical protein
MATPLTGLLCEEPLAGPNASRFQTLIVLSLPAVTRRWLPGENEMVLIASV